MSEEENFIARWSRRKRKAEHDGEVPSKGPPEPKEPAASDAEDQAAGAPSRPQAKRDQPEDQPVDLASLPPLESITEGTDIRAFLQSGVPADLARAALRRAWATDPAIRDFIEIAENQWDFANPASIPGFGPLQANDDVAQLVSQALGKLGHQTTAAVSGDDAAAEAESPPLRQAASAEPGVSSDPIRPVGRDAGEPPVDEQQPGTPDETLNVAVQHDSPPIQRGPTPNRRSHGGALPQ
jgi:hypothetical protein